MSGSNKMKSIDEKMIIITLVEYEALQRIRCIAKQLTSLPEAIDNIDNIDEEESS